MIWKTDPYPPVLARLKAWLEAHPGLPKSPWGQAAAYSLKRWEKLRRYTEDGRIEIDNNLVENAIRPIALGRKNYLFAGSHEAAQRAAVIYALVATCKQHAVNPEQWLSDVLSRIAAHPMKQVHEFLPHHWKISSPYDAEARYSQKRQKTELGELQAPAKRLSRHEDARLLG